MKGASGSGFIISDASGTNYVVTNYHVIAQAYTLSVTFERQDGFKKTYNGLKVIAADEETDLALLGFAPGDKPVDRGLQFLEGPAEEGENVYSAGFPGLGTTAIWQFGNGMVSNAIARFPKNINDETLMGPFIQHTAQVDPGNSGGPLLVPREDIPAGYAVAGVNTLSALWRQAANYAIPADTTRWFIDAALNPRNETWRAALDKRLSEFTGGLGVNRAVYPHIAGFLSSACIGENAEYAVSELLEKAPRTVQQGFASKCEDSVVGAMAYAVAWTIETNMRGQGSIRAAVKEVSGSGDEYTVVFTINGNDISSRWTREYGAWRVRTFGEIAMGNKELIAKKETEKNNRKNLRINSNFTVEAGYAYLFDKAPAALYFSAVVTKYFGAQIYFAGPDLVTFGVFAGYGGGFSLGSVGLMPYIYAGIDYHIDKDFDQAMEDEFMKGFPIVAMVKGGLKITTAAIPGLFGGVGFQYNLFDLRINDYKNGMKMAFTATAGYAF
ncbi:MAG: trypsin-like peptidase domain-containing protein [Treponema sp.]|nr:trypsin-like peptidase domain-containing protein [Treponema sp.]